MSAAGAAACGPVGLLARLVLDLEGVPATAGGRDVWVVDGEAALEPVDEVDLGALQVWRAVRVDDDVDAVDGHREVALLGGAVEAERVLKPRAAAALHRDAEDAELLTRLLGQQRLDLHVRGLGQGDQLD